MISTDTEVGGFLVLGNGEGMKESDGIGALAGSVYFVATVEETHLRLGREGAGTFCSGRGCVYYDVEVGMALVRR